MTERAKTCVYAIALNEIKFVDQFMDHCQGADLVLVCDTGSTDGTAERLRERGAVVHTVIQRPWRFDIPRNTALSLVPSDIDICLSIDLDEFLQPGWTDALEEAWQTWNGGIKRISYDYIWNWKDDGVTPDCRFFADKIHHRHGYRWRHPCHETLYWEGQGDELRVTVPGIVLHHRADPTKSRGQYLPLLKLAVEEDPNNDRMSHYYGRELMFYRHYDDCITELTRHLSLPTAGWKEERCASMRYIARSYRYKGEHQASIEWAVKASMEWPHTREPWLELARSAHAGGDWHTAYWAATKCLSITKPTYSYMGSSDCWGWEPYDLAAISSHYLGLKDEAIKHGAKAIELSPSDQRLQNNMKFYQG